jgi:hypothetical protein
MSTVVWTNRLDLDSVADTALKAAARPWFLTYAARYATAADSDDPGRRADRLRVRDAAAGSARLSGRSVRRHRDGGKAE